MDLTNNVGNGLLIAYDTYTQLRDVDAGTGDSTLAEYQRIYGAEEGRRRWEVERITRIIGVLARAAVNGYLTWVSLRDTTKSLGESQKALEELSQVTNPELSWGLAMSYKQSGQTAESRQPGSVDADLPRVIINPDAAGKTPSSAEIDRAKVLEMRHPAPRAEIPRITIVRGPLEEEVRQWKSGRPPLSSPDGNPAVTLWRGTVPEYLHGTSRSNHDLTDGLYLTRDRGLGLLYAQERRAKVQAQNPGEPGLLLRLDVLPGELGRVLDFHDTDLYDDWVKFLKGTEMGPGILQKGSDEIYQSHFLIWLMSKRMRVGQFDTISGPEFVRGGNQVVILDKKLRERLMSPTRAIEEMRIHEPLVPAYPDEAAPIDKELWKKLKQ
jgi:hypothetical protein